MQNENNNAQHKFFNELQKQISSLVETSGGLLYFSIKALLILRKKKIYSRFQNLLGIIYCNNGDACLLIILQKKSLISLEKLLTCKNLNQWSGDAWFFLHKITKVS